ncbi:hypothetical protein CCACVL1_27141 [Corchorus capsularis]|uniref:DUF2921 domain-containing protein n=1 Tax=Corchorus capsularis TaxID=210143 RepID=A0A1R3GC43_COCAP|nr:hypothetical protein CCACVL1_27141 [Corchorus capsularis]
MASTCFFSCETESTESAISYSEYCSKIVPESNPYFSSRPSTTFGTLRQSEYGAYYPVGENRILNSNGTRFVNSFLFRTRLVYKTDRDGVFKIESRLAFQSPENIPGRSPKLYLKLQGFWSESSGNLCMVGEGSAYNSKEGKQLTPAAVLKLTNIKNSCNITTLITGTLVSLSSNTDDNYFEPVSLLMIPQLKYNYTVASEESEDGFSGESDNNLQGLPRRGFFSLISQGETFFDLQYTIGCSPGKNCFPFDGKIGYNNLPSSMSLRRSEYCSEIQRRLRLMIEFHNVSHVGMYRSFNPNSILIGEGFWDYNKNQLSVLACRFLNIAESWSVGDCTTRLTLTFPGILSIRETSTMMGQIWSDSGYFYPIMFRNTENHVELSSSGLKYEYTEMERVKKSCPRKKPVRKREEISYASAYNSIDMEFEISVKTSEGKTGWGSAVPVSVGDRLYNRYSINPVGVRTEVEYGPINISYEIGIRLFYNLTSEGEKLMKITAEGIYDSETGFLCMVGCRKIGIGSSNDQVSQSAYSLDCEILLNFQFPPIKPDKNGGYVKGSIESRREKTDPLYFNPLHLASAAYVVEQAKQSLSSWNLKPDDSEQNKVDKISNLPYEILRRTISRLPFKSVVKTSRSFINQMEKFMENGLQG